MFFPDDVVVLPSVEMGISDMVPSASPDDSLALTKSVSSFKINILSMEGHICYADPATIQLRKNAVADLGVEFLIGNADWFKSTFSKGWLNVSVRRTASG